MKSIDYLIVGAGPAGLQLAYFLEKMNRSYVILEKSKGAGSFFERYPRHRKLISINKVHTGFENPEINMRWDWNSLICEDDNLRLGAYTKEYFPSADKLVEYLRDFATHFKLKIDYGQEVVKINKENDLFNVQTKDGSVYQSKVAVVGTGIFKPFVPDIPGIEHCENYTECSVDTDDFINKRVLVIGKGNSAFETADHLVGAASTIHVISPTPIKLAWETHFVGHLRAVNNNFIDTYQLKSQNNAIDGTIHKIEMRDGRYYVTVEYLHSDNEIDEIVYDKVLVATGFRFDNSIFDESITPELAINDRFPKQTCEWESTNIDDLYFIGAITQQRDFKKYTSAFIHGFRYNVQCLFHILENKYQDISYASTELSANTMDIATQIMERINTSSSLWQQYGFLCDLVTINPKTKETQYYETLSVGYVHESGDWEDEHQFLLTLEFGKPDLSDQNIFSLKRQRQDEIHRAHEAVLLHPIIRHYYRGEMVGVHHVIETLEARWNDEELHLKPLMEFLEKEIAAFRQPKSISSKPSAVA